MHPHETLLREFFAALGRGDAEAMARCYHPEVFFSDPVFPRLRGPDAADLWRMLLARPDELEVALVELEAGAEGGRARWTARYRFGRARRPVVNRVRSLFAFREGLIVRHYDHFPFWAWSRQALGPAGVALGWFAPLKWGVRRQAARALERFQMSSTAPEP